MLEFLALKAEVPYSAQLLLLVVAVVAAEMVPGHPLVDLVDLADLAAGVVVPMPLR